MNAARSPTAPAADDAGRHRLPVLGVPIDRVSSDDAVRRISAWAGERSSRVVCICNVHSVVTAAQTPDFMQVIDAADLATPDGAPVAWMLRRLGARAQRRVSGPDLFADYCAHAAAGGERIYLYGSTPETLQRLESRLRERWPGLQIAGSHSPPFRALSDAEDDAIVRRINDSGAGSVWISLGCPKQERWMHAHRGRIRAVMVGVGAAFDFHAGTVTRAPRWMRDAGLEWLHRLASEPRRLWRRYLLTNSWFMLAAARQLLGRR